MAMLSVDGISL